ncbi:hypothetical protein BJ138DRAFT_1121048 [Hygrophoropsis aurantiaca]|uniref:Uncharacterized protein n=1 Tax=Hygrophoropsis aurantiaca TaxID=72124 RepID=A0ACB7ZNU3_9AGAM|nr:hypothetical protein BJ138DRAFT_1121048 [Hygrophoropsis aurantiaca]
MRGLLDFLFLAQYPCHTEETLRLLDDALNRFHDNKSIFIDLGIRTSFNLPKLHSLRHYINMIREFGTTDNYNTEYTERLHIDLTKDAYRATNHKDEYNQMTLWLERKEKMQYHDNFVRWRQNQNITQMDPRLTTTPDLSYLREFKIAKYPSAKATFQTLDHQYGAHHFQAALARFIVQVTRPTLSARRLEDAAYEVILPVSSVSVFHKIRYNAINSLGFKDESATVDAIHVKPQQKDQQGRIVPARFDTVLVNMGEGRETGIEGYRVAQVRVVFSLSEKVRSFLFRGLNGVPEHLAYVEWFSPFPDTADANHALTLEAIIPGKARPGSDGEWLVSRHKLVVLPLDHYQLRAAYRPIAPTT